MLPPDFAEDVLVRLQYNGQLAAAPHRTVLALFTHTALHMVNSQ